jgi:K+-sensing histidine kinase KdpD
MCKGGLNVKKVPRIMVCVTRQKTCERLIKIGKKTALEVGADVFVVHVAKEGSNFLDNPHEGEALEYLFQISKNASADMTVLRSNNVVNTLAEFANKNMISTIILGESPYSHNDTNIIRQLEHLLPNVEIKIVSA